MSSNNSHAVKKEFDAFASKISRLELLRRELDMLDVEGFESDVRLIRAKLNDINALPQVEKEIRTLQRKIGERSHKTTKAKDGEFALLRKRMSQLQKLIEQKRKVSVKKQLNQNELLFVRDVPKLEKELRELRVAFEKHMHSQHTRVDSGIGLLVDTKFDDFVSELKGELTDRLRDKELSLDSRAKEELQSQRAVLMKKYQNLIATLNEKYKQKIREHLQSEVKKRFDSLISKRLAEEKKRVISTLLAHHLARLQHERKEVLHKLEMDYNHKQSVGQKILAQQLAQAKFSQSRDHELLKRKIAELEHHEKLLARKKEDVDSHVDRAQKAFNHRLSLINKEHAARVKEISRQEQEHIAHIKSEEESRVKSLSEKEGKNLAHLKHQYAGRMKEMKRQEKERMAHLAHREQALSERSDKLKILEEGYNDRLHRERKKLAEEFDRRKVSLHQEGKSLEQQKERIAKQKRALLEQVTLIQRHQREAFDKARKIMDGQVHEHKRQQDLAFAQKVHALKAQMHMEVKRHAARIEQTHKNHINQEVKKREGALRAEIKRELDVKYMKLIAQKEAELNRKKLLVEREVMGNLKKVLS